MKLYASLFIIIVLYVSCTPEDSSSGRAPSSSGASAIPPGTISQYYRGDKTFAPLNTGAVPESTRLYFTNARAIGANLEGLDTSITGSINSSDTILSALGKTQKQIDSLSSAGGSVWTNSASNIYRSTGNVGINTIAPSERLHVVGNILADGKIRLKDSGSNYVDLKAPATVTSYTLSFPTASGNNGQLLTTSGSGQLTWTTLPTCNAGEVLKSNGTTFSCISDNAGSGSFAGAASRAVVTNGTGSLAVASATSTEIDYLSGATSNIQTQLNAKLPLTSFVDWSIAGIQTIAPTRLNLTTAGRAVATDGTGVPTATAVTATELGYLSGVTSSIQTQLSNVRTFAKTNLPACGAGQVLKGDGTSLSCVADNAGGGSFTGSGNVAVITDGTGSLTSSTVTATEIGYLSGVSSNIQTQFNNVRTFAKNNLPVCGAGQVLKSDGTTFTCVADNAGSGAFSGSVNVAVMTNGSGALTSSAVTSTELGYLSGVTSAIQTQLNNVRAFAKSNLPVCAAGEVLKGDGTSLTCVADNAGSGAFSGSNNVAVITNGTGALASSTVTATELGYLSGVTSNIQTQFGNVRAFAKANLPTCGAGQVLKGDGTTLTCVADNAGSGAFTGSNNVAVMTNGSGALTSSTVTATELGYLSGVTSNIQTQFGSIRTFAKTNLPTCNAGEVLKGDGTNLTCVTDNAGSGAFSGSNNIVVITNGSGALASSAVSATELGYLSGLTGNAQSQINSKLAAATFIDWASAGVQTIEPTRINLTTANRAIATNASGVPTTTAVTAAELGHLSGVTSNIQTQLNSVQTFAKTVLPTCGAGQVLKGDGTALSCIADNAGAGAFAGSNNIVVITNGTGALTSSSITATELGYLDNVTSDIQTQLNSVQTFAKTALPTCGAGQVLKGDGTSLSCVADNAGAGAFSGSNNIVVITNGSGALTSSAITATELSYLDNVTSDIQNQINGKLAASSFVDWSAAGVQTLEPSRLNLTTASRAVATNASGVPVATAVTSTELGYLSGVTSSIQTQLGAKLATAQGVGNASKVMVTDGAGNITPSSITTTLLGYLSGVTSDIQTQFTNLPWGENAAGTYYNEAGKNVGIGTSNPTKKLEVAGAILSSGSTAEVVVEGTTTSEAGIRVTSLAAQVGPAYLVLQSGSNSTNFPLSGDIIGDILIGNAGDFFSAEIRFEATENHTATKSGGKIIFSTQPNGATDALEDRMIIDHNGNIGIGKTPHATYKVDVSGDINATANVRANGVVLTSDNKFKKQVTTIKNAVEKLLGLRGVTFYWKDQEFPEKQFDRKKHYGFIAQETEKIIPEIVVTDSDGFKAVEYANITSIIVEAFKDFYGEYKENYNRLALMQKGIEKELQEQKRLIASVVFENKKQDEELKRLKLENKMLKEYLCSKDKYAPFCKK